MLYVCHITLGPNSPFFPRYSIFIPSLSNFISNTYLSFTTTSFTFFLTLSSISSSSSFSVTFHSSSFSTLLIYLSRFNFPLFCILKEVDSTCSFDSIDFISAFSLLLLTLSIIPFLFTTYDIDIDDKINKTIIVTTNAIIVIPLLFFIYYFLPLHLILYTQIISFGTVFINNYIFTFLLQN